jgi:hypothetical protein
MNGSEDFAARTELLPVQTLTLTDQQFLTGDSSGKATAIVGQLRIAQGAGRLPLVVLQHGSIGFGPNIEYWSRELTQRAFRRLRSTGSRVAGSRKSTATTPCLAVSISFDVLAAHPRIRASTRSASL